MKVAICQSNYLPWKGYFDLIHDVDVFVVYDGVQYTKNDWRNRNRIYSKNGLHWLTIPIPRSATKSRIRDVRLPGNGWEDKHWRSIRSSYGAAPFWSDLERMLRRSYASMPFERLTELNQHLIALVCDALGCATRIVDVADLDARGDRVTRLIDVVTKVGGTHYVSGPAARGYLDGQEPLFEDAGIRLSFKDYSGYPPYPQFREPFEHAVSIIDLIAHVGIEQAPKFIWAVPDGPSSQELT